MYELINEKAVPGMIAVGKILKPFGVKGWAKTQSFSEVGDWLQQTRDVLLCLPHRQAATSVMSFASHPPFFNIKFALFQTPEEILPWRQALIFVQRAALQDVPFGSLLRDLIDLEACDDQGNKLGLIKTILVGGAQDVLVIERADRWQLLVPVLEDTLVKIVEQKQVWLKPLPGLEWQK